ncbi:YrdB family protein [Nocardia araoensis]|uniref:YrdB family protein n=1 Tax=Nocardia araoensis TaxID=228600 RepID=UPI001FDED2AB|nr:YrdB family protein [Nocardia araoensis]
MSLEVVVLGVVKAVNLGLMFLLELSVLGSAGYWGFTVNAQWPIKIAAGIGAPLLLAVLWGLFAAGGGTNATYPLHGFARMLFELAWFGTGALALYAAASLTPAAILFACYLVNGALRLAWNQG